MSGTVKTALLIDDDEDFRALMSATLTARGFRTLGARKGRDADAVLERETVDVVIVDGLLPDGSGVDWIARWRGRGAVTPVIFVSAFFRDAKTFRRLTTDLAVSFVVYKPVDPRDLARTAEQLVGVPRSSPRPAPLAPAAKRAGPAAALATLREEFGAKLPAKVDELSAALAAAQGDPSRIADARTLAHRLRGTAGSYGYPAVGEAAGRLEDLLAKAEAAGSRPRPVFWRDVKGALDDTRLCVAMPPEKSVSRDWGTTTPKALLVVDDDTDFLALVREGGRLGALPVVTAQTPAEALQIARSRPLVGALLDVHLDGGAASAFHLAAALRQTPGNETAPIAFASIDQTLETRIAAIEAGAARFVEKPLSDDALANLAQQLEALGQEGAGCVLIVDDDPNVVADYSRLLRSGGIRVEALPSAEDLFTRLDRGCPDLLILDVDLPKVSGIDICRAVRMSDRWELLPILVATAHGDARTRLRAFRAGATDVLIKPALPEELLARVRAHLDRARLMRERSEKDFLSGLLLRRPFLEAFQRALSLAMRANTPISVALLDLDEFKRVNDQFGHAAGDSVIAGFGALLRRRFRAEDLRGRWGGEEFIVAFPGQVRDVTGALVARLLADFSSLRFKGDGGESFSATFSGGVATFPGDGNTIATLISRADERLYFSKKSGRNRVSVQMTAVTASMLPKAGGSVVGPSKKREP